MLQYVEAVENPSEVARLFLIFMRRGVFWMEESALIEACKRTAGYFSAYPRPIPAIAIALAAGFLLRRRGNIYVTERGKAFAAGASGDLTLSTEQSLLLIGSLLDEPSIQRVGKVFLSKFQFVNGRLIARKRMARISAEEAIFCRMLRQIGALESSDAYFALSPKFDKVFENLIVVAARLSQKELLERLDRQRDRGERAEVKVVELEKARLLEANRADLAKQVYRISVDDVSAGYDISSFEKDGAPRYIEVKSSIGSQISFQWSEGERTRASIEKRRYLICFVPFSFSLPELLSPVVLLRDPISMITAGKLIEIPDGFRVTYPGFAPESM